MNIHRLATGAVAAALLGLVTTGAVHAAIIINPAGTVALGVNDDGSLNTTTGNITSNAVATGLAYNFGSSTAPDWRDATAPGCLCEGWGVSINGTTAGWANQFVGTSNLSVVSFVSGPSTATSVVSLTSMPGLTVTHAFAPAPNAPDVLFRSVVTIENGTDSDVTALRYVRVMDWDIPPTEFDEFVTIQGVGTTGYLLRSHDNGFESPNPLIGLSTTPIDPSTLDTDFTDSGPDDHGAYFLFGFGDLAAGEQFTFEIFYGAAGSESEALTAIAAEGIELFSLGQSNGGEVTGEPATFIFGFKGVGGSPVLPPPGAVPEPASLGLVGLGLLGLVGLRRRRSRRGR